MTQSYYQPLDASKNEIRVLYPIRRTEPDAVPTTSGPWADNFVTPDLSMVFELRTVSQDDAPVYTALSYVWGDAVFSKTITINDCIVPVTENLEQALRHLQYDDIQPAIWIDAVCINQSSNEEKSDQVARMARIYSDAREVIIWLGPDTPDSKQMIRLVLEYLNLLVVNLGQRHAKVLSDHVLGSYAERHSQGHSCELIDNFVLATRTVAPDGSPDGISTIDRFALWWESSLLTAGWWYRIWTVQEYVLARSCHFQIGLCRLAPTFKFNLGILVGCMREISYPFDKGAVRSLEPQRNTRLSNGLLRQRYRSTLPENLEFSFTKGKKFFDILMESYSYSPQTIGCKDARDRIFALCSLAEEDYKVLKIETDYRKSPQEVYADVAHRMIASGEMDILSVCRRQENVSHSTGPFHHLPDLPTWAPDWSAKITKPCFWVLGGRNMDFSASNQTTTIASLNIRKASGEKSITLAGILVGEVSQVGKTYEEIDADMRHDLLQEIRALCKTSQDLNRSLYSSSQLHEAIWRLPIWDLETRRVGDSNRATRLSKARHDACVQSDLASQLDTKIGRLSDARRDGSGVLARIWTEMLIAFFVVQLSFREAMTMLYSEKPNHSQVLRYLYVFVAVFWPFPSSGSHKLYETLLNETSWSVSPYISAMESAKHNRLVGILNGYIGWVPLETRPGDVICIFFGSRVPHVLRKRGGGQPGHTLVGDAFVYGAMDGELMRGNVEEAAQFEIF
jgi:hypothetical protein